MPDPPTPRSTDQTVKVGHHHPEAVEAVAEWLFENRYGGGTWPRAQPVVQQTFRNDARSLLFSCSLVPSSELERALDSLIEATSDIHLLAFASDDETSLFSKADWDHFQDARKFARSALQAHREGRDG